MQNLIVLVGSDRVGKSTYAEYLKKQIDGCRHESAEIIHFGAPDPTRSHPFYLYRDHIKERSQDTLWEIWDRSHLCAIALEPWRRGKSIPLKDFDYLNETLKKSYGKVFVCVIETPWCKKTATLHYLEIRERFPDLDFDVVQCELAKLKAEHEWYYNQLFENFHLTEFADHVSEEQAYTDSSKWDFTAAIDAELDCLATHPGLPC